MYYHDCYFDLLSFDEVSPQTKIFSFSSVTLCLEGSALNFSYPHVNCQMRAGQNNKHDIY